MKTNLFFAVVMVILGSQLLTGCAGLAEGITKGMVESQREKPDTRQCNVRGKSFRGLESYMLRQEQADSQATEQQPVLKVLMVHGIGEHKPGYATQLAENLAQALGLSRTQARFKELELAHREFPGETLGTLRVSRFFNQSEIREMVFYELTWDPVIEAEKQTIAYDNSGEYSFRRAGINNTMKLFVNSTVPDVLIYQGNARERIQTSVGVAMCWMFSSDWKGLPDRIEARCSVDHPEYLSYMRDDYAFVTHSLGSRIMNDTLQMIAEQAGKASAPAKARQLQEKALPVFMLSNQLPLLQLGQPAPEVRGQIDQFCDPGGRRTSERLFDEVTIVAFSDPNDVMSYAIPPGFIDRHMDSRLCPRLVNVIINVADVINVFGIGEAANPMTAHVAYENDQRVIALIARGIGTDTAAPIVAERCKWMETL